MLDTKFTIFYSNTCGTANNQFYPYEIQINSENDLKTAVSHDHVCARYQNNHRKKEHFIQSNCTMFDIDNSDSDNSSDWIYPVDVREQFPDKLIQDSTKYQKLKHKVCAYFTAFDDNAKDSVRFFFGVENPQTEFYDGNITLSDFMESVKVDIPESLSNHRFLNNNSMIPYGKRHSTLFECATRVVTRWGESDKAYYAFCNKINTVQKK